MAPRIVFVGAGSTEFTRNLLGDILSYPELRESQLVLHDIDSDRLRTAERMARWTADAMGAKPRITASLDRREALARATVVIDTIQVGGADATQLDFDLPARYGLQYTINDTINIGGVFRGLRTIPVVVAIWQDMVDVCPDALFLNYTNPMAMLVRALDEYGASVVGLCHSVYWTVDTLAGYLGLPAGEVDAMSGGMNHLAWILRLEHRGRDLYPDLREFVASGRIPDDDLVRADLFRRFGFYPTESSEHQAEYNPWFIPKDNLAERMHVRIGEYLRRVSDNLADYEATKRRLDAGEPFEIEQSGEYAAVIVHSLVTGAPARIVANVPNHTDPAGFGGGSLIANLPPEATVEVPALVDGLGVHPVPVGPLPPQCAAYTRPAADCADLTVRAALEEDRDLVYHAVLTDPQIQARLSLDEAWRLTDELIAAEARWLPDWLGGSVRE
jgi:alpha-galactosidase